MRPALPPEDAVLIDSKYFTRIHLCSQSGGSTGTLRNFRPDLEFLRGTSGISVVRGGIGQKGEEPRESVLHKQL